MTEKKGVSGNVSKVLTVKKVKGVISGLLTVKEVSAMLGGADSGWAGKKIRRLIRQGKVDATKNIGRWFFDDKQVDAIIALATGKAEASE